MTPTEYLADIKTELVTSDLVLFHISNLDFFHRSEPRPRGD
jgi:hypothetical protein